MHHAQFRAESLNIVSDVGFQGLNIDTTFIQSMKYLFLKGEGWRPVIFLRLFEIYLEFFCDFGEVLHCNVGYGVKRRRLKIFESGMVEYLAH